MAFDLWTKKQNGANWAIGGDAPPPAVPAQWRGRRRRRHHHHRPGQPGQPGQQWTGTPPGAPPAAPPPSYPTYNPYAQQAYSDPQYQQWLQQQQQPQQPTGPQPTIDVFVGQALRNGVPVPHIQKELVRSGYDPVQISTIIRQAARKLPRR